MTFVIFKRIIMFPIALSVFLFFEVMISLFESKSWSDYFNKLLQFWKDEWI